MRLRLLVDQWWWITVDVTMAAPHGAAVHTPQEHESNCRGGCGARVRVCVRAAVGSNTRFPVPNQCGQPTHISLLFNTRNTMIRTRHTRRGHVAVATAAMQPSNAWPRTDAKPHGMETGARRRRGQPPPPARRCGVRHVRCCCGGCGLLSVTQAAGHRERFQTAVSDAVSSTIHRLNSSKLRPRVYSVTLPYPRAWRSLPRFTQPPTRLHAHPHLVCV